MGSLLYSMLINLYVRFWLFTIYLVEIEAKTWIWQGALMSTSIRFVVKTDEPIEDDFQIVAATGDHRNLSFARQLNQFYTSADFGDAPSIDPADIRELIAFNTSTVRAFHMVLEGLQPNTEYTWSALGELHGRFKTPPPLNTPFNFTFAFASCADNDSNHELFSLIPHNEHPLFMLHLGDLHYGNLVMNDISAYSLMFDRTLLRSNPAHMFRELPIVYMWDDHDYGPNSKSRSNPSPLNFSFIIRKRTDENILTDA